MLTVYQLDIIYCACHVGFLVGAGELERTAGTTEETADNNKQTVEVSMFGPKLGPL